MTHTRLRKFNTKDTYPDQDLDNDLCQVVRAGNMIFLRGQVGSDFEGTIVGVGDPAAQADQAMKNVKQLLEEAGSKLDDICKITIYLTDRAYREPVYRTIGKWLKGVFPVSTGVIVDGLAKPEWVMEIDVIAVMPGQ
ncbi:MAG: RidA family protein [Gammaproteobacteria bacterium]|nr:RidA family protein [Gammaproteobacteria bacterium]